MMFFKILRFLIGHILASTGWTLMKFELKVHFGPNYVNLGFDDDSEKNICDFYAVIKIFFKILPK